MSELSERIRRNVHGNLEGWVQRLLVEAADENERLHNALNGLGEVTGERLKITRQQEREACARTAEAKAAEYLSPEYATGQPLSSFSERFACKQVAEAIRARTE